MAQQLINIGASPNDGTGTPLRTSFDYTNQNFTELYAGGGVGTSTNTQVLFNDSGVLKGDAGLVYNKTTDALTVTGPLSTGGTLAVTGVTTLTGAATVQGLTVGKGAGAVATNTAFGINVLAANTIGLGNTGVGTNAMQSITQASSCVAIGYGTLASCQIGNANISIGQSSLGTVVSGSNNTAMGVSCLLSATGSSNVGQGYRALNNLGAGDGNTATGTDAGITQTAGGNNAFFGSNSSADNTTGSNQYNYGDGSVASHKFRMGNLVVASGNVMIGVATAGAGATLSLQLANTTAPTAQIAGGQLFVVSGVLKYMDSAGVVKTITMV